MSALNRATRRRLKHLPQLPNVWEGDRRTLPISLGAQASEAETRGDCVLWVDGSQGAIRAMDVVPADAGPEAMVRILLQAMEFPQGSVPPARPQKIVVGDREAQFFLRGVLQQLDITIEYAPALPLVDEIFRGFEDVLKQHPPDLPPEYAEPLTQQAYEIWQVAPWDWLSDHQILSLTLDQWDIGTLYVSVLGMLGEEYGILMYRSLDSLKRFRQEALADTSLEQLEQAFLEQDCLFLSFEPQEEILEASEQIDLAALPPSEIQPSFGTLHPLEGLRPFLHEEEAATVLVTLNALHRFFSQHQPGQAIEAFPALSNHYRIPNPTDPAGKKQVSIKIDTMPALAEELFELGEGEEMPSLDEALDLLAKAAPVVRDDLIPKNSFFSLGAIPWQTVEVLRLGAPTHQPGEATPKGDGLPIVLIQTTRPKAKAVIQELQAAGGLRGLGFNPGQDPISHDRYDLGILQTQDNHLHLFGEFDDADPVHQNARKKWDHRCQKTKGWCGLIVAGGLTGAARGNPQVKDMLALYEVQSLSQQDFGLGILQLVPSLD